MADKKGIAKRFGRSLDQDQYEQTRQVLSPDCRYIIGDKIIKGPQAISDSYEQNMIEGKRKLDKLVWGECKIEAIDEQYFYVHFTDYITHKGQSYTHKCSQKVLVNDQMLIEQIEHIHNQNEMDNLHSFYKAVGVL